MKTRKVKTLQNVREVLYLPNRSALPKPGMLYLMRLRSSLLPADPPQTGFVVPVTVKDTRENHAQAVKITHQ